MRIVVSCYGTRGDVEPCAAIARELVRRGHDVRIAVPPDLVEFANSAGLAAIPHGVESRTMLVGYRRFWMSLFGNFWNIRALRKSWGELYDVCARSWGDMSATLMTLAEGADVLFTGLAFERTAANVAEYYDLPLATLHYVPARPNSQLLSSLPGWLARSAMSGFEWLDWLIEKKVEDAQRAELGLSKATGPAPRRFAKRGTLEIQAYDEFCFAGLKTEWAKSSGRRPFVGAPTMELPTEADEEVLSWIAAGRAPIFFGFGSMPVDSPAETFTMISEASAQLGERALVCAGWSDFSDISQLEHVKVVEAVNLAAVFPLCRALVHHGGVGTTTIGMRAGVPTLILSMDTPQMIWGAAVKRLQVGTTRRFTSTTKESLVADLRTILDPKYCAQAREIATQMAKPAESAAAAADLLEDLARARCVG
ncbi:glycosyl transferase family 1 [Mycobacterium sp. 852002-51971_SCH5477799-a]|uniref:glycosyltransferase n=1 Tax=Mycobacterium sp. 852002-51971_SCH5477799-a TaxID=1834106 RepID=UPI0007FE2D42|nr:glycosyltransferase [Mycobacterium sp. 852002-51971_SCH5477799-a]OBF66043.1 glycosyl transferase family 1 [Mycobacterium sp. 852002-51971_SCH5477799-a]